MMKADAEDVVLRAKKRGIEVGVVSDAHDDLSDDSADEMAEEHLKKGMCRVAWLPWGVETIEDVDKVRWFRIQPSFS
jgi:hypothetical protein